MVRSETYNTKQKDIILNFIKNKNNEFTIKEIYNNMQNNVGLTTIYRLVDKLVDEGSLKKIIGKDKVVYYQYLEKCNNKNHFYLKCNNCGKILHIDCDCIEELSNHITNKHNFKLDDNNIMINGKCENCRKD